MFLNKITKNLIVGVVFVAFTVAANASVKTARTTKTARSAKIARTAKISAFDASDSSIDVSNTVDTFIKKDPIGHTYLGVMAGVGFSKVGKQNQVNFPLTQDYFLFIPSNNMAAAFLYGVNGGYEFKLGSNGLLSFGAGVYRNTNYHSKGRSWYVDAAAGNLEDPLNYKYEVRSTRFMAETQIAWQFDLNKTKFIPFVLLGVGPSLNYANSYKEPGTKAAPVGGNVTDNSFESKTKTSFSYQFGAGLALPFNGDHDRLCVAYRYVDLGIAKFGNSNHAIMPVSLDAGRIRANEVYVGYIHLFDF